MKQYERAIPAKKIARGCTTCAAALSPMTRNVRAKTRACYLQILRRARARVAQNKCKNARVPLACTTKDVRFRRRICARLLRVCSAVAKDDMQCLRRSLQTYSAEFAPHAHAPRAKTNAKMRALGRNACDSGKENCTRLRHVCGAVAADDAQCLR